MSKYVERMPSRTASAVGATSVALTLYDRDTFDTFGAGGCTDYSPAEEHVKVWLCFLMR